MKNTREVFIKAAGAVLLCGFSACVSVELGDGFSLSLSLGMLVFSTRLMASLENEFVGVS